MLRQRWASLCLLTGIAASEGVASMLTPPYFQSLGFSLSTIGILIGLYAWTTLLSRLPSGMAYHPQRARRLIALALFGSFVAALLYPATDNALALAGIRLLHGLCHGVASTLVLAQYLERNTGDRAHAMTWYALALTTGFLVGNFLGGVLGDYIGYPAGFALSASFALVSVVFLVWEKPAIAAGSSTGASASPASRTPRPAMREVARLARSLRDPKVASVALVAFTIMFFLQLGAAFFPLYGISVGLSLTELGLIRSCQSLAMVPFTPLAKWPIRWWGHRRTSYYALGAQCVILMLVPAFRTIAPLAPIFGLNGAMRGVMHAANAVSLAEDVSEKQMSRGMASSILSIGQDLGGITSPIMCGFVASAIGLSAMFLFVPPATLAATMGLMGLVTWQNRRRVAESPLELTR